MKPAKTRNNNTMTESAFWGMLRSTLRQKSRFWLPVKLCLDKAKRPYVGPNKRQKYEYQCAMCKKWFIRTDVEVDHIIPAGSLKSGKDLELFVEKLFCEVEGLRCLCKKCHHSITHSKEF